MAARRAWVVFVDNSSFLVQDNEIGGKYNVYDGRTDILSVFFRESHAIEAAKYLAQHNPGKDVHVLSQSVGFTCQSKPVEHKEWTKEGFFLPVAK